MKSWTEITLGSEPGLSDAQRETLSVTTPFVHWNLTQDDPKLLEPSKDGIEAPLSSDLGLLRFPTTQGIQALRQQNFLASQGSLAMVQADRISVEDRIAAVQEFAKATAAQNFQIQSAQLDRQFARPAIPLAGHALNPEPQDVDLENPESLPSNLTEKVTGTLDQSARQKDLPKDTVIVGIIDDGLALGHARFRLPQNDALGTDTRFLAAWIQEGLFKAQTVVPFGRDVFRSDIRQAIEDNTKNGWLDEAGFDRQIHPASPDQGWSPTARQLEGAVAHGTHVLDLACGHDPIPGHMEELRKQRIIAVTLPGRAAIGMAGTYLEYFVAHAMRRIVAMADKLWQDIYPDDPEGGFDLVLNLSYGQQSGTKSGTSVIEQEFTALEAARSKKAELHLVMPVGNDNLTRSNARWSLKKWRQDSEDHKARHTLKTGWRILPQDQSSNFVEVWADLQDDEVLMQAKDGLPLEICLCTSEGDEEWLIGRENVYFENADQTARIYACIEVIPDMTPEAVSSRSQTDRFRPPIKPFGHRLRYVVGMRPTLDHNAPDRQAQAGLWLIKVRWREETTVPEDGREIYINVQVDQNPTAASRASLRTYFEHPDYRTHLPSGRVLDNFAFLPSEAGLANKGENLAPADFFGHVQRQGSQNALANHRLISSVTGHRESDGRPADFAATFYPESRLSQVARDNVSQVPKKSYPVDSGAVHLGILAAGPRSGSKIALRGTSFAAPQEARRIIESLREPERSVNRQSNRPPNIRGVAAPRFTRTVVESKEGKVKERGFLLTQVVRRGM